MSSQVEDHSARTKCPQAHIQRGFSAKTNELEWSRSREAKVGPATVKDVLLSKRSSRLTLNSKQRKVLLLFLSIFFLPWGTKRPVVLSKRARWACALWLNSGHIHTSRTLELISIHSRRSPFSPFLTSYTRLSPLCWWFPRENGNRCCLSTYSSGGQKGGSASGRQTEVEGDAERRRWGGPLRC